MQTQPPTGWVELDTLGAWNAVRGRGGFIVIGDNFTDTAEGGPKFHHRGCRGVKLAHFRDKVLSRLAAGQRPTGHYFWVASERMARAGGARPCDLDDDPLWN